jgi:ATP-binding cassette subfamily A (ABC1) protein 3
MAVNLALTTKLGGATAKQWLSDKKINITMRRFPYPPYLNDSFVLVIQQQLPLILMLSFVFVSLNIVKNVVHEKEKQLKESMKMMGLGGFMHWIAWFITYLIILLITVSLITLFYL